ncbi:MAG TPA: FAD-dependent monooxygenase [Alphaproteobacteria bacterium]|nr:FAD-dependent monooxygenase [Alphaproteobacteria bacterium]
MPNSDSYDAVISGGGLVGLTLGLALARSGLKVAVVDTQRPEAVTNARFDGRVSAIALASCRMLKALGLWQRLESVAQPINDILVTDGSVRGGASPLFLHFDHREIGNEPLGSMIENRHTRIALIAAARETSGLTLIAPMTVKSAAADDAKTRVALADGRALEASLCIAAEGRASPLRAAAGLKLVSWDYDQSGIVTTVEHEKPHNGLAHEYFLPPGPFAILPMTGNRSSLVWTERRENARAIMALPDDPFAEELRRRFGTHLGAVKPVGPRWSYPLSLQIARSYIAPRLALVGDACHAIHPIAGQGFNLGLRDVAALAEILIESRRLGLDIGAPTVLEKYQRWRRFDNIALTAATDVLTRLFSNDVAPVRLGRDVGLAIVNRIGPARRFFMRHAGGALSLTPESLPRLLRGEAP